jgi:hypothetical protein
MTSHPDRRVTQFPGSNEIGLILPQQVTLPNESNVAEQPAAKLKRHLQRAPPPPRLPVKAKPNSNLWSQPPTVTAPCPPPSKRTITAFCEETSPWQKYHRIVSDNQAGPVVVAHEHRLTFSVVAIKEREVVAGWDLKRLIKVQHGNIVNLLAAFRDLSQLYLVYESMPVSLSDVQACPFGPLKEFEMATVCKEVGIVSSAFFTCMLRLGRFAKGSSIFSRSSVCATLL